MSEQEGNSPTRENDLPRWLTIGAPSAAVILLIGTLLSYFYNFHGQTADQETWGQFGDFVGGVLNPFLAFLAFVLLLATLHLQNRELQNSSRELAKSAEALNLQNEAFALQNFENTFFQMLRRISDLVAQTKFLGYEGREAFKQICSLLAAAHARAEKTIDRKATIEEIYKTFYSSTRSELGHYFRSLYHVFTFIDRSHLTDYDKSVYANIVRAQLSMFELTLLFYNGLVGEGEEGFKPLIEKYGILKHVDARDLLNAADRENKVLYQPTAFMGRDERQRYAKSLSVRVSTAHKEMFKVPDALSEPFF
jgi:hypothetical protein